jgi:hypothetical protein
MASGSGCGKADEVPECSAVKEKDRLPVPTSFSHSSVQLLRSEIPCIAA